MSAAGTSDLPADVQEWIGRTRYPETADFPVERGYIWTSCASTRNGNPLFWDDTVATELTGGPIAPPTTLSLWFRPHHWQPGQTSQRLPLQVHFDLKDRLGLPEAVMTESEVVLHEPVRPGDVISTSQVLRSVSEPKTTRLGTGRFWVIEVPYRNQRDDLVGIETFTGFGYVRATRPAAAPRRPRRARRRPATSWNGGGAGPPAGAPHPLFGDVRPGQPLPSLSHHVTATTVVLGALATRDWRPMHHDRDFAVERNGARDIFLNTPNQQAWFERFVTDWTGPRGRLGRMLFRMHEPVCPGDVMTLTGTVESTETDGAGCGWATVAIDLAVGSLSCSTGSVRVGLPVTSNDNPWRRHRDQWIP